MSERLQYKVEILSSADTAAIERAKRVQDQLNTAVEQTTRQQGRMQSASSQATGATRNNSMAVLELSRAYEDAQYGIRGVINNIPTLVMALGGGMGLAGAVSLVAVLLSQLSGSFDMTKGKQKELTDATEKEADAQEKANREAQEKIREEFRSTRREIDEYLAKIEEADSSLSAEERTIKRGERAGLADVSNSRQLAEADVAVQRGSGAITDTEAQRRLADIRKSSADQEQKIRDDASVKLADVEAERYDKAQDAMSDLQKRLDEATRKLSDAQELASFQKELAKLADKRERATIPPKWETPEMKEARLADLPAIKEQEKAMQARMNDMMDRGVDLVTRSPRVLKTLEEEVRTLTDTLKEQIRKTENRATTASDNIDDQTAARAGNATTTEIARRQAEAEIAAANRTEAERKAEAEKRAREEREREMERADREARAAREGSQRSAMGTAKEALAVGRGGNLADINLDQLAAAVAAIEDGANVAELERIGTLLNAFSGAIINNSQAQQVRLEIVRRELEDRIANLRNGN